jgi:thiamine biosynthesis lipoprotein
VKDGYPSQNGVVSFTIIGDSSLMADALSTSCFILGREKGLELLESLGIQGFCVTSDKKVYATKDLKENLEILDKSFSF